MKYFMLALLLLIALPSATTFGKSSGCKTTQIAGVDYVIGRVFLESAADTSYLSPLGFKRFEFLGRSVSTVQYATMWPANIPMDSLPAVVSGIECESVKLTTEHEPPFKPYTPPNWAGPSENLSPPPRPTPDDGREVFLDFSRRILAVGQLWPRPADKLPDSTIDGEPYVRGLVFVENEDDLVDLEDLGFKLLRHDTDAERHHVLVKLKLPNVAAWDEENMEKIPFRAYRAYWPIGVVEHQIPEKLSRTVLTMLADSSSAPVVWRNTKDRD